MRTKQEIFDTVVAHLRAQQCRSTSKAYTNTHYDNSVCLYRGHNNTKCAVGCLIPDQDYRVSFENRDLDNLIESNLLPDHLQSEFTAHRPFLRELQKIHDNVNVVSWEKHCRDLAETYHLQYKAPEEA